jgi:3-oxoacyl-[acyl-carrier protein] reductase
MAREYASLAETIAGEFLPAASGRMIMGVALVTGASRSLGAAMAKGLAGAGWSVAVNYAHDDEGAAAVVDDIASAGGRAMAFKFDVTDKASVRHGIAEIDAKLGPLDVIVNNATGPQPFISIEAQTWDDHLDQLRFFVKAPLLILQEVLPSWKERRSGKIINIGSEVVDMGNAEFAHYVGAKAAMIGMTRSLRHHGQSGRAGVHPRRTP